ncbi:tail fiber protein [Paenibacillus phocaensis]|nr:tail fiber protein [Paenibacillus phocaensis]
MSSWSYALTNKGRQLQAKAQAGAHLVYTRMAVGSGTLSGQSLESMTALIAPVKDLNITRLKRPAGATRALIGATLTNQDVTTGFYLREIGIFATDPDDGEILYMYANAGATADYITPQGDGVIEKAINMNVFVGSAANITANIDESLVYVTQQELADAIAGIQINDATTTQKGIVQLSNATNSTAEDRAATPKAVKSAYDAAVAAQTTANAANLAAAAAQAKADAAETPSGAQAKVNAAVGNLASLQTTAKGNTVAAINELFTSASNGKNAVAAAITGKGVPASGSDTFAVLAGKIGQIKPSLAGSTAVNASIGPPVPNPYSGRVPVLNIPAGCRFFSFKANSLLDSFMRYLGGTRYSYVYIRNIDTGETWSYYENATVFYLSFMAFDLVNRTAIIRDVTLGVYRASNLPPFIDHPLEFGIGALYEYGTPFDDTIAAIIGTINYA